MMITNISKELINLIKIGEGGSSIVYKALHENTGLEVALKIIDLTQVISEDILALKHEINTHKNLDHPFIVHYFCSSIRDDSAWVIMEYVGKKTLLEYINNIGGLNEAEAQKFFIQLICSLQYLHFKCHLSHGDLKLENIVLDNKNNLRLIDFGLCHPIFPGNKAFCGSLSYSSPEVILNEIDATGTSDIWSSGIILYAMLFSELPFNAETEEELENLILNEKLNFNYNNNFSKEVKNLLNKLLEKDPKKRITIPEISRHKWITSSKYSILLENPIYNRNDININIKNQNDIDELIVSKFVLNGIDSSLLKFELLSNKDSLLTLKYKLLKISSINNLLDLIRSAQKINQNRKIPFTFLLSNLDQNPYLKKRKIKNSIKYSSFLE